MRYTHFLHFDAKGDVVDSFWVGSEDMTTAIDAAEAAITSGYVDWDYVADDYAQMNDYEYDEASYWETYA